MYINAPQCNIMLHEVHTLNTKKYLTLIDPQWVDSFVQDYSISSALAIELLQTCTKPLIHSSNIMNAYSYLYENNAKIMFFIVIAYSITLLTLGNKENETDGGLSWLKHISYWSGLLVQMTFNTLSNWKLVFKEYTQIFLSFSQWFSWTSDNISMLGGHNVFMINICWWLSLIPPASGRSGNGRCGHTDYHTTLGSVGSDGMSTVILNDSFHSIIIIYLAFKHQHKF